MSRHSLNPLCGNCTQDLIRDCPETLRADANHPCFVATVGKFAQAAEHVGIDLDTLINTLQAGVPITAILDLIQSRLAPGLGS